LAVRRPTRVGKATSEVGKLPRRFAYNRYCVKLQLTSLLLVREEGDLFSIGRLRDTMLAVSTVSGGHPSRLRRGRIDVCHVNSRAGYGFIGLSREDLDPGHRFALGRDSDSLKAACRRQLINELIEGHFRRHALLCLCRPCEREARKESHQQP